MDYAKAIRISRALADVSQRELARRISTHASLVSMFENGKRRPSLKTLENIAEALGLPFHLLAMLGMEPKDTRAKNSKEIEQLAVGLTKLLLGGDEDDDRIRRKPRDREAQHSQPKTPRAPSRFRSRKAS